MASSNAGLLMGAVGELLSSFSMDIADESNNNLDDPQTPPILEARSSDDVTPVSQFRRDASFLSFDSHKNDSKFEKQRRHATTDSLQWNADGARPTMSQEDVIAMRFTNSADNRIDQSTDDERNTCLSAVVREQRGVEGGETTLHLDQAREAISAVSDPSTTNRLSDDRIQQILLAAMRYEKDHAPTVASRQPTASDSAESNTLGIMSVSSQAPLMPSLDSLPRVDSTPPILNTSNQTLPSLADDGEDSDDGDGAGGQGGDERRQQQNESPMREAGALPPLWNASTQPDGSLIKPETPLGIPDPRYITAQNRAGTGILIEQKGDTVELVGGNGLPVPIKPPQAHIQEDNKDDLTISSDGVHEGQEKMTVLVDMPLLGRSEHREEEEKKDGISTRGGSSSKPSRYAVQKDPLLEAEDSAQQQLDRELKMMRSYSMTESDVGSIDGLPSGLQSSLLKDGSGRDKVLQRLDGVVDLKEAGRSPKTVPNYFSADSAFSSRSQLQQQPQEPSFLDSLGLSFLWPMAELELDAGDSDSIQEQTSISAGRGNPPAGGDDYWHEKADEALDLLGHCSAIVNTDHRRVPGEPMPTSLVRVAGEPPPPSFAATIREHDIDTRLQSWIDSHYAIHGPPPADGTYDLGRSRTVIVHEIARGDWTWCTAWSPKGDRLAVATENHHLAVIETTASTVWRVRHDRRLRGPAVGDTTHSIRSMSWGKNFIAVGGTGNAVSILSPIEPYAVLHVIKGTGFVGSLDWRVNSNQLAIASRAHKFLIVHVRSTEDGKQVVSETLYTAQFQNWVNRVAFSPSGAHLAVGNASGALSVYSVEEKDENALEISPLDEFQLDDSVLALNWSPDGKWLYAGGEDFHISVIETKYWELIHKINRERWVQCIASSCSGTHVAIGGVSSEISILDVRNGWNSVMGIELKGLVPLSASWHPKDQALALTGQNDSVLVVETTNARHVKGHHLHAMSPIIAVGFSPDGRTAVIGNEAGVVTFFTLSGSTFEIAYELVVILNDRLSIAWSSNGRYTVIGSKDALIVVGQNTRGSSSRAGASPHRSSSTSTGFSIQRVIRRIGETNCVSIDSQSQFVAAAGDRTRVFDATNDFQEVRSWKTGVTYATAWSPDGQWLATMGFGKTLSIYDTSDKHVERWRAVFSLKCDFIGLALAWGPRIVQGLVYLAYGGANKTIYIMEIRTLEGTWETVLRIPRDGQIRDLDWSMDGLLAAGIDNGTVSVVDLAYLQSGIAVNEKDYNWQRQALTCFTEIRRNRGRNSIKAVRWIPSAPGSDNLLAVGGTDGEVEIVDLTARRRCRGYRRNAEKGAV